MGLFDWLRGAKAKVQTDDRIWLTKQAKFAGIEREIAQALGDPSGPDAVFVVAHFHDCLDEFRSLVAGAGFDEGRVLVTCSEALEGRTAGAAADESRRILIIVGERHPLPSHDDGLLDFARSLSCQCRFVQHASLEDPLLRMFSGEWIEGVPDTPIPDESVPDLAHFVPSLTRILAILLGTRTFTAPLSSGTIFLPS